MRPIKLSGIFSSSKQITQSQPSVSKKEEKNWRLEEGSRPSRPQHCWNQLEYWEESWRSKETCCHSDFS